MTNRSAGAGRDGKLRELVESIRESADFIRVTGDSDDVITSGRSILADVRQIDAILAVPDPLASSSETQGEQSEILAWLNGEQKKADRWTRVNDGGVFRFMLTGPELMRIRRALEQPFPVYQVKEWQCRYVFPDSRCCGLRIDHGGDHDPATSSVPVRASGEPQKRWTDVLCTKCGGNGVVKIQGGISTCPRCDGRCYEPDNASASPSDDGARQPKLRALIDALAVLEGRCGADDRTAAYTVAGAARAYVDSLPAAASGDGAAREPGLDLEPIKAREAANYLNIPGVISSDEAKRQDLKAMIAEIEHQRARIIVLGTSVDSLRYLIDHPVKQENQTRRSRLSVFGFSVNVASFRFLPLPQDAEKEEEEGRRSCANRAFICTVGRTGTASRERVIRTAER